MAESTTADTMPFETTGAETAPTESMTAAPTAPAPPEASRIAELETQLATLRREKDDLHIRFVRQASDFDGYMKRSQNEVETARKLLLQEVLRGMIGVVDDLDRVLAASESGPAAGNDVVKPLVAGVRAVTDKFAVLLRKYGVEPIESLGRGFDPSLHEAVAVEVTDKVEDGTILSESCRGWRWANGTVLRPARVKISQAPPPSGVDTNTSPSEP